MKHLLYLFCALSLLLSACSSFEQQPNYTHGIYTFDFSNVITNGVDCYEDWEITYTYNDEIIKSGHQFIFPLGIFSFHTVYIKISEKAYPDNIYIGTLRVAICDGGSGKAEIPVEGKEGNTVVWAINCVAKQIGKQ